MTLVFPDWLTPPLLFFLYIFAIQPGWFGRIRKPQHRKLLNTSHLSTLHPYSIKSSFTVQIPNSEPLNSTEAFSQPGESCIRLPSLTHAC